MFSCDGCQQKSRDKDLGSILKYSLRGQQGMLRFCWPVRAEVDCFDPLTYYLGQNMSQEQRSRIRNVRVEIDPLSMEPEEPERTMTWDSFEDFWLDQCDALRQSPLEEHKYKKPLEHYQRRAEELAEIFGTIYKMASKMVYLKPNVGR